MITRATRDDIHTFNETFCEIYNSGNHTAALESLDSYARSRKKKLLTLFELRSIMNSLVTLERMPETTDIRKIIYSIYD